MSKKQQGPRVLVLDIETSQLEVGVWALGKQHVGLEKVRKDWNILAWAAKWLGDPPSKVMYRDQRNAKNVADDSKMLKDIWGLMDQADIIVGQNSQRFDVPKLYARFAINKFKPPSSFKQIDTCRIAAKTFGFTSNKLAYLTEKLCTKYRKLEHKKFPGQELWDECIAGNKAAWREMEKYNKHDVLATEELYKVLIAWDSSLNFSVFYEDAGGPVCACGSRQFNKNGHSYLSTGKYQRYSCAKCNREAKGAANQIPKEKRKAMLRGITR